MQAVIQRRGVVVVCMSFLCGIVLLIQRPFPGENNILQLVRLESPYIFSSIKGVYILMLFSTPYIGLSLLSSLAYILVSHEAGNERAGKLPPYPQSAEREELFLVIGEVHHARKPTPVAEPYWLAIPKRGLFTGIAIFGAIGSGKTTGAILPFAEQILSYRAQEPERRVGGLVLEVKGDLCGKVQRLLRKHGRLEDYVEISLEGETCYNPLHNDQDAYAIAFGIASLLNNLYGRGKDPFWQQAYTNLVKFIVLLHKVLFDYVTLFDVYECAINPKLIEQKIEQGEKLFAGTLSIQIDAFAEHPALDTHHFVIDHKAQRMRAPFSMPLREYLETKGIDYAVDNAVHANGMQVRKREQFEAVKRWFYQDWARIEPKLRTSIIEGISVFLSLFDDNPDVKRVFCPPKNAYETLPREDSTRCNALPPWSELIEAGKVVMLNFPVSMNPGLARTIGTLLKLDFERAVLNRIPSMEKDPEHHWREVLFLCDEFQAFATVGEQDPTGDEKFFALSRQARCIPIVATQSISSLRTTLHGEGWRSLLQTFRTKIFMSLSDDFSAETASRLCGKEEMLKPSYSLSENGQDADVSVLTGRAASHRATLSTSKSYSTQLHPVFEPKVFMELRNAQSIVLAFDGVNPLPATYCYLKPCYLDNNKTYFEQLESGGL